MKKITRIDLEKKLHILEIPTDSYTIFGSPRDESLCIQEAHNIFSVFYYERGTKSGERIFESENDACQYFLEQIISWFKK